MKKEFDLQRLLASGNMSFGDVVGGVNYVLDKHPDRKILDDFQGITIYEAEDICVYLNRVRRGKFFHCKRMRIHQQGRVLRAVRFWWTEYPGPSEMPYKPSYVPPDQR